MGKPYRAGATASSRREVYEVDEIRRVIKCCPETPAGHRDRFAVMTLWCAGLKPSELLSLRPADFTPEVITAGKREVVIPGGQRQRLAEVHAVWMEDRALIAGYRSPLFCNLNGTAMDSSYLRHAFASLSEAAELGRPLTAQGFRNTFAAAMHRCHVPLELIRRQLGLSDLDYTATMLALIAPVEQHAAMDNFSLE
jgi:integrase